MSEWSDMSEKVWGITVSPPDFQHDVQQGLYFCLKKKLFAINFFNPHPFPTYLGYHHLLFKGVRLQKENYSNLYIYKPTTQIEML